MSDIQDNVRLNEGNFKWLINQAIVLVDHCYSFKSSTKITMKYIIHIFWVWIFVWQSIETFQKWHVSNWEHMSIVTVRMHEVFYCENLPLPCLEYHSLHFIFFKCAIWHFLVLIRPLENSHLIISSGEVDVNWTDN